MFLTQYDTPVIPDDFEYSKNMEQFNEVVMPDGTVKRSEADPMPLYDLIQSYESECNLANIFARYQSGDLAVANQRPGMYLDLSGLPDQPEDIAAYLAAMSEKIKADLSAKKAEDPAKKEVEVKVDADDK